LQIATNLLPDGAVGEPDPDFRRPKPVTAVRHPDMRQDPLAAPPAKSRAVNSEQ
jgi:hypothetical protein